MVRLASLCVLSLLLVTSGFAQSAEPPPEARRAYEAGAQAWRLGRFSEALDQFTRSYELYNSPVSLFNRSQCLRKLGRLDEASFGYTQYLSLSPDGTYADVSRQMLAEIKAELAERKKHHAPEAASVAEPVKTTPTVTATTSSDTRGQPEHPIGSPTLEKAPVLATSAPSTSGARVDLNRTSPTPKRAKKTGGYVAAGTVVGLVVVGGAIGIGVGVGLSGGGPTVEIPGSETYRGVTF